MTYELSCCVHPCAWTGKANAAPSIVVGLFPLDVMYGGGDESLARHAACIRYFAVRSQYVMT